MGIPSYFSYIVRNHRNIMVQYKSNKITIHNLYMDCNSIIYDVIYELEKNNKSLSNDSYIIKLVCDKIKSYIHLIKPKNNVYIAFDGVAPFAKMNQQKTRRYKTYYENNLAKKMGINKVYRVDIMDNEGDYIQIPRVLDGEPLMFDLTSEGVIKEPGE